MAKTTTKKITKKTKTQSITPVTLKEEPKSEVNSIISNLTNRPFLINLFLVILVGTTIFYLSKQYRGMIIAAVVNKNPISRFQLNQTLVNRYGDAVLEELINNQLLKDLSADKNLSATDEDIDAEIVILKDTLGGEEALNNALDQYGLSLEDLKEQISLKLLQEKLMAEVVKVEVTDEEVSAYFDTNKDYLYQDQKLEDVKEEIKLTLEQQKKETDFYTWFEEQKTNAQVKTYLN